MIHRIVVHARGCQDGRRISRGGTDVGSTVRERNGNQQSDFGALKEMARALKPGGRLQIGDILVEKEVGEKGKRNIDLWKG